MKSLGLVVFRNSKDCMFTSKLLFKPPVKLKTFSSLTRGNCIKFRLNKPAFKENEKLQTAKFSGKLKFELKLTRFTSLH